MSYPISIPEFEGQKIEVVPSSMWSGPKLLVNGVPASKGPKRGEMVLRTNDGRELIATWKPQMFDVPQLKVGDQIYKAVEPLKWYQWVWSGLPIAMIFLGGAIGALIGFIAFTINTRIFRSNLNKLAHYPLTLMVTVLAVILYLIVASTFVTLMNGTQ
jgi:hypothetical protein